MQELMSWLQSNHHDEIISTLEKNRNLSRSIKLFIVDNHSVVVDKLDEIHRLVLNLYASNQATEDIALLIDPNAKLSNQALDVLKQMNSDEVVSIKKISDLQGHNYCYIDAPKNGNILITDKRFIQSDLESLVDSGFLAKSYDPSGAEIFTITRPGGSIT